MTYMLFPFIKQQYNSKIFYCVKNKLIFINIEEKTEKVYNMYLYKLICIKLK